MTLINVSPSCESLAENILLIVSFLESSHSILEFGYNEELILKSWFHIQTCNFCKAKLPCEIEKMLKIGVESAILWQLPSYMLHKEAQGASDYSSYASKYRRDHGEETYSLYKNLLNDEEIKALDGVKDVYEIQMWLDILKNNWQYQHILDSSVESFFVINIKEDKCLSIDLSDPKFNQPIQFYQDKDVAFRGKAEDEVAEVYSPWASHKIEGGEVEIQCCYDQSGEISILVCLQGDLEENEDVLLETSGKKEPFFDGQVQLQVTKEEGTVMKIVDGNKILGTINVYISRNKDNV